MLRPDPNYYHEKESYGYGYGYEFIGKFLEGTDSPQHVLLR